MLFSFPKFTFDTQATSHLPMYAKHSHLKIQIQTLPLFTESPNFFGSNPEEFKLLGWGFFSENVFHKHLGLFNNLFCTDITLFFGPLVLTFKQRNLAEGLPQQCHCIYSEWKCMKNVEQFPLFSNT